VDAKQALVAAGAATAGLVGGWALGAGSHKHHRSPLTRRRRVLGVPVERKSGLVRTAELLRDGARELHAATDQVATTGDDMRQVREQLDQVNRRSPIEIVLDGLTHRPGATR
jgi:hypothetical protein